MRSSGTRVIHHIYMKNKNGGSLIHVPSTTCTPKNPRARKREFKPTNKRLCPKDIIIALPILHRGSDKKRGMDRDIKNRRISVVKSINKNSIKKIKAVSPIVNKCRLYTITTSHKKFIRSRTNIIMPAQNVWSNAIDNNKSR